MSRGARAFSLCGGLALLAAVGCDGGSASEGTEDAAANGAWVRVAALEPARRRGLQMLQAVEHFAGVVVVAGATYENDRLVAAVFRRAQGRWAGVVRAPLRWRSGYSAVSMGRSTIVWGGAGDRASAYADGARFDGVTRRWRSLPASPLVGRSGHSAVRAGAKMLVWGGVRRPGLALADGASFAPGDGTWTKMDAAPFAGSRRQGATWTGDSLVVASRGRVAAYRPDADRWQRLPRLPSRRPVKLLWTGRELVAWNGEQPLTLRPRTGSRWRRGARWPGPPTERDSAAWAQDRLYVWDGVRGAVFAPRTNTWRRLRGAPLRARDRHAVTALGADLFVWGGCCIGTRYLADGAIFDAPDG